MKNLDLYGKRLLDLVQIVIDEKNYNNQTEKKPCKTGSNSKKNKLLVAVSKLQVSDSINIDRNK